MVIWLRAKSEEIFMCENSWVLFWSIHNSKHWIVTIQRAQRAPRTQTMYYFFCKFKNLVLLLFGQLRTLSSFWKRKKAESFRRIESRETAQFQVKNPKVIKDQIRNSIINFKICCFLVFLEKRAGVDARFHSSQQVMRNNGQRIFHFSLLQEWVVDSILAQGKVSHL